MSIQSTQIITREYAISRIKEVSILFRQRKFFPLSKQTEDKMPEKFYFENQKSIDTFYKMFDISTVEYSNKFLEEIMNLPFYRYSMFENYIVGDINGSLFA